jgi:hypothetical protein
MIPIGKIVLSWYPSCTVASTTNRGLNSFITPSKSRNNDGKIVMTYPVQRDAVDGLDTSNIKVLLESDLRKL